MQPPIPPKPPVMQRARQLPPGWFSVDHHHPGHKGTKEDVLREIQACPHLDPDLKVFLVAKITATDCKALEVHAHCQIEKGGTVLHVHLKPLF